MNMSEIKELVSKAGFQKKQLDVIHALVNKISMLDDQVQKLQGQLTATQNENNHLQIKLDEQEAYSRRPCLVVSGVDSELQDGPSLAQEVVGLLSQTGIKKETLNSSIDKLHQIGKVNNKGTRSIIVKFKEHSFKEEVYKKRKNIKNNKVKLKPSLTKRRQDILEEANQALAERRESQEEIPVQFAFADVHGNLKALMKDNMQPKFQNFTTLNDFYQLLEEGRSKTRRTGAESGGENNDE